MNKEKLLALADSIEGSKIPGLGFNMGVYYLKNPSWHLDKSGHECRTVACIGGHAVWMEGKQSEVETGLITYYQLAQRLLELPDDVANDLMLGFIGDPTPQQAAACIRNLVGTGKVDWDEVMEPSA